MKVVLSADHRGASAIRALADKLNRDGFEAQVLGKCEESSCDYPERAFDVATSVAQGNADLGILICGTGIGMSIAANKVKGARAAVVHDEITAQLSRSHNDANIICISADLLGQRLIEKISDIFLKSEFEGGRHARRVRKIAAIEAGQDPSQVKE